MGIWQPIGKGVYTPRSARVRYSLSCTIARQFDGFSSF
ncbi:hypothetical protein CKA32_002989 [Geitlerinema sp. FC II]|nr:hypothetical protein CKA32_002989 [Geitlerinema sp. FC II]